MKLERIHGAKKFKVKWFLLGTIFTLLITSTVGFASRYLADEHEIKKLKKGQKLSSDVEKIKRFILTKQKRTWDSLAEDMARTMAEASQTYKVPLDIVVGINCIESQFYPFAVSSTGALGVSQVDFSAWARDLGTEGNPYDPVYNIKCGAWILNKNIRAYGVHKGLHIYNVGAGNYSRGVRNPKYMTKVYSVASEFRYFN